MSVDQISTSYSENLW